MAPARPVQVQASFSHPFMEKESRFSEIKLKLVGILGKIFIDLLCFTIRIKQEDLQRVGQLVASDRVIYAIWHSRMLLFSYLVKGRSGVTLVSQSRDGEFATRIINRQGNTVFRGSTTRGGPRAMVKLIRALKEKDRIAMITVDGPQGPRCRVQPGVITLAKKTGYPILAATYSGRRIKVFSSWDRFVLPYPFTTCKVKYGSPLYVPKDADKAEEKRCLLKLEKELNQITDEADAFFGHQIN